MHTPEEAYTTIHYHEYFGDRRVDWTIREPNEADSGETLLIVPGIMAKRRAYDRYARRLAKNGRRSVTMSHETGTMFCADEVVDVINRLVDDFDQPVRIAGHSLGGIHAAEAVASNSDGVSGLLLLQPAGFGGVNPLRAPESILRERSNHRIIDEVRLAMDGLSYAIRGRADFAKTVFRASAMLSDEIIESLPPEIDRDAIIFPGDLLIDSYVVGKNLKKLGFNVIELATKCGHNAQYYCADEVSQSTHEMIKDRSASI